MKHKKDEELRECERVPVPCGMTECHFGENSAWESLEEIMATLSFLKFDEDYKPTDPRCSKRINMKKTAPRHIIRVTEIIINRKT